MYRTILFMLFSLAVSCIAQDVTDYTERTILEVREKNKVYWDTTVPHKAGFKACYQEVSSWVKRNSEKHRFLVSVFNKDSGVVQIALPSDCKLRHKDKPTKYYMVLTSRSNSFEVSYDNVDQVSQSCMEGLRKSMVVDILMGIRYLLDSTAYNTTSMRLGFNSNTDSIFYAMRTDSIAQADSLKRAVVLSDSVARAESLRALDLNLSLDTVTLQRKADSILSVVEEDSVGMFKKDLVMFRGQSIIKSKLSFETRIECLKFMLKNNLTTINLATVYLMVLKKYCTDRQDLFYSMRHIVNDRDRPICILYYKKAKDQAATVQTELYRIGSYQQAEAPLSKE